ncbi:MAG: hypothetical protein P0Y62_06445 [Candidatus Chryseobacterium colombiense]|nr:hypothetical protein [Chryseobacterium sp.]WEK71193.1 MAG: hypothetical protein P0Y62_06445 [Chryseobacterium sp.]
MAQVDKTAAQVCGKAEKYIIPNIGHTPHKEAAELTFNAVKNFITNEIARPLVTLGNKTL